MYQWFCQSLNSKHGQSHSDLSKSNHYNQHCYCLNGRRLMTFTVCFFFLNNVCKSSIRKFGDIVYVISTHKVSPERFLFQKNLFMFYWFTGGATCFPCTVWSKPYLVHILGPLDDNAQPHGPCTVTNSSGDRFEGHFTHGEKNGKGKFFFIDGRYLHICVYSFIFSLVWLTIRTNDHHCLSVYIMNSDI